jgi:hypothetical protein
MIQKRVFISAIVLLITLPAFAADVSGTWVFSIPGPDGTSRDTYFRLRQDGRKLSGVVQAGYNNRTIENGSVEGNHLRFSTSFTGRGQTQTVTYEGDVSGDELHIRSSGGGVRRGGPSEMKTRKTADDSGLPAAAHRAASAASCEIQRPGENASHGVE